MRAELETTSTSLKDFVDASGKETLSLNFVWGNPYITSKFLQPFIADCMKGLINSPLNMEITFTKFNNKPVHKFYQVNTKLGQYLGV